MHTARFRMCLRSRLDRRHRQCTWHKALERSRKRRGIAQNRSRRKSAISLHTSAPELHQSHRMRP